MVVLHANWLGGRLWLWGETSALSEDSAAAPPISPFSLLPEDLARAAALFCGGLRRPSLRQRHARTVAALLPAYGGRPVPSNLLLLPASWHAPPGEEKCDLGRFGIAALPLSAAETFALFAKILSMPEGTNRIEGKYFAGGSLLALSRIWKLAASVLAGGRVLPAIREGRAIWTEAPDPKSSSRRNALFGLVPKSACAIEGSSPPAVFYEESVDAIARFAVATRLSSVQGARGSFFDLHTAFLAALRTPSGKIRWGKEGEIESFGQEIEEWRRPAGYDWGETSPLGFRIADPHDPDAPSPRWTVVPVAIEGDETFPVTAEYLSAQKTPRAIGLLTLLGQASGISKAICASSDTGVFALDSAALGNFLKEDLPRLSDAGFPVYAPSWWKGRERLRKERIAIKASEVAFRPGTGLFSLDSLLSVKWEIALGDDTVSGDELEWMISQGSDIVRFSGRWVCVNADELRLAKTRLERLAKSPVTLRELVRLGLGQDVRIDPDAMPVADGGGGRLPAIPGSGAKIEQIKVPALFSGELRPYQKRGLDWLHYLYRWGFGACLADDMGLGKTVEAIAAVAAAKESGLKLPVLVVCPMSIMLKWSRELGLFAPSLSRWIYHGQDRARGENFSRLAAERDVCITSYQMIAAERALFGSVRWGIVVLDEAQNIKNPATAKSKAVRSLDAAWRLALTGTPIENGIGDLWAIMDFLNSGLLGSRKAFSERYQRPFALDSSHRAAAQLRELTAPFILRRLKSDEEIISSLPRKVDEKVYCSLTREQAELYAAEVRDAERGLSRAEGVQRQGAVLSLLTRLKQICNHPMQYFGKGADSMDAVAEAGSSGKLRRLDEMLSDVLAAGECSLVFTQYAVMGRLLSAHLSSKFGFDVPFLHGGVPVGQREEMVARFQRPDGPRVFILSIRAGGTGLDLTRANHVFHYDRWWNPAVESQATDRAHRIGQSKTVFVHRFICEGTLESRIDDLIEGKIELAGNVIKSGEKWLAGLDDKTLKAVVELSEECRIEDVV